MRRARSPILCALLLSGLTLTACGGGSYGPGYYHEPYGLYPYPYSAYGPYLAKPYGYGGSSFGFGGVRRRW